MPPSSRIVSAVVLALAGFVPAVALANPHALPFSYPYSTNPQGAIEVEQYTDLTPVPAYDATGNKVNVPRATLTTEIEYGLLDRLELGLYFVFSDQLAGSSGTMGIGFDGVMQRLRLRLAEAGEWPVDVSLYLEIAELKTEFEVEGKINLEKRFGKFQLLANLWLENEYYFTGLDEWVLNPTLGADYQIVPQFSVGIEGWMHQELGGPTKPTPFNNLGHFYVGPAVMFQSGRFWVSVGAYLRLEGWDRTTQIGDLYGRVWVRSIIGIQL